MRHLNLRLAALLVGALSLLDSRAQLRNANWVFAEGIWVSFVNEEFTLLPPAYVPTPRNACISDTTGQFMLLVDDTGIRNATFGLVAGGSAAELGWDGMPAANYLVLPDPGNAEAYYVLINEAPPSGRAGYAWVDLSANAGSGQVQGGTTWYMENVTAKLNATLDAQGTGYWIIQHADEGDAFHAYHLLPIGWQELPVISNVGSAFLPDTARVAPDRWGHMRISSQGDQLALIKEGTLGDTGRVEVFHFHPATGALEFRDGFGTKTFAWSDSSWVRVEEDWGRHLLDLEFDTLGRNLFTLVWDTLPEFPSLDAVRINWTFLHDTTMAAALDSLTIAHNADGLAPNQGSILADDPNGRHFGWGLDGHFYATLMRAQPDQDLVRFYNFLRDPDQGVSWSERMLGPSDPAALSLPLFCKRYHDSMPSVGVGTVSVTRISQLRVRPNPLVDQAVLELPGHTGSVEVRWRDALGRPVQTAAASRVGPTWVVQRQGIPSGLYILEAWDNARLLGMARVVCE